MRDMKAESNARYPRSLPLAANNKFFLYLSGRKAAPSEVIEWKTKAAMRSA